MNSERALIGSFFGDLLSLINEPIMWCMNKLSTMEPAHSRGPEIGHPLLLVEPLFGPGCCRKGSSILFSSTSAELDVTTANGEGAEPDLGNVSCSEELPPVRSRRRPTLGPPPAITSRTVFGMEEASVFPVVPGESCLGETYGNFFWRLVDSASSGIRRDFRGGVLVVGAAAPCPPSLLPDICLNLILCLARSLPLGGVGFGEKADPQTLMPLAELHLLTAVSRGCFSCLLAGPPVPDSDRRRAESASTAATQDERGVVR